MQAELLQPVAVLIAWSLVMWVWLYATRIPAMRAAKVDVVNLVGSQTPPSSVVPASVQWKADNYNHLMEQPTLFYAAALVLAFSGSWSATDVLLAWAYVAFRIVHSLVQAISNRIIVRFALHVIGTLPLIALSLRALYDVFVLPNGGL